MAIETGRFGSPCIAGHTALIYDRGGANRQFQISDLNSVGWARELDAKSRGRLAVTGRACRAQSAFLNSIVPRRHELVLFRGSERVWEGPVVQTRSTSNRFELDAADIFEYLDGTALSKAWPNSDNGGQELMTERLREIITYELTTAYEVETNDGPVTVTRWEAQDPPANIVPYLDIREGTTKTRAVTEAFEMTLGEHVLNLARSIGVNFTVVGRRLVIWDGFLSQTRVVTETDFSGDFEVIAAGSDFFTIAHVVSTGGDPEQPPPAGHAANDMSYYGPWDKIISTDSEGVTDSAPSADTLNTQARRGLTSIGYPLPLLLNAANGSALVPSPGMTIDKLVPGVNIPVRTRRNLRRVKQMQRLDRVEVTESVDDGEKISVRLTAAGVVSAA